MERGSAFPLQSQGTHAPADLNKPSVHTLHVGPEKPGLHSSHTVVHWNLEMQLNRSDQKLELHNDINVQTKGFEVYFMKHYTVVF